MSIAVRCGQCGKQYTAPDEWAGKRAKCPKCGAVVEIPTPIVDVELVEPMADLLDQELGGDLATADPLSDPFAAMPAPAASRGGLGRALPSKKPKKGRRSDEPSIASMLMALARSQKLLAAVALGMCWVILWQLYLLVTSGLGPRQIGGGILVVMGAVIVIGGLRGTRRRDRSTDKARATKLVGWFIVGVVGIGCTLAVMVMVAKMGVPVPTAANLAGPFVVVFGLIVVVSGMLLAYYVLVLLFPRANIFRIAGWGYVGLTIVVPLLTLVLSSVNTMRAAARQRAFDRDMAEFKEEVREWGRQAQEKGRLAQPHGMPHATPPVDAGERSSRPSEGVPRPGVAPDGFGPPPRFPGPRFRGPTGPRRGFRGPVDFDTRLQQLIDRFGADKVVTITVHNVSSQSFPQVSQRVRTAADAQSHTATLAGSLMTVAVAPVDDVEGLASKLDIGKVTEIDSRQRTITIERESQ